MDKQSSLQFYHTLCNIIGSEEVVKTRRCIFTAIDFISENKDITLKSTGSKAEGLDFGGDYDQMIIYNCFRVYENENGIESNEHKIPILMDMCDTGPGFTKLKLYRRIDECRPRVNAWCQYDGTDTYISSKKFRESHLPKDMVIHGPCQSNPDKTYDGVVSLSCKEWISPAHEWIHRNRARSAWPNYKLYSSIVKSGVLFVPIGFHYSLNEDLEWRISFSLAERQLVCSFSHTKLLCYALLKIILKDVINKVHPDLICSYFLKTIMFWLSEESNPYVWKPDRIIPCFMKCLKRLLYCVEHSTCFHYFISDKNLFEDRFNGQREHLSSTIKTIYELGLVYLNMILKEYGTDQRSSFLSCLVYPNVIINSLPLSIRSLLKRAIFGSLYSSEKEIFIYLISMVCKIAFESTYLPTTPMKNKNFYRRQNIMMQYMRIGLYTDGFSTWTSLASWLYKWARFRECEDIIQYCLSMCTSDKILLNLTNSMLEQNEFQKSRQTIGLLMACKNHIISDIEFQKPFDLLPQELFLLRKSRNLIGVPPVVYLLILHFLCLHHSGQHKRKKKTLRVISQTINNNYFIRMNDERLRNSIECLKVANTLNSV